MICFRLGGRALLASESSAASSRSRLPVLPPVAEDLLGFTCQLSPTTAAQGGETSETTLLGCPWQDCPPSRTPVPHPGHFKERGQQMHKFRSEKKLGTPLEQVRRFWLTPTEGRRTEGREMEWGGRVPSLVKGLISKVEKWGCFPRICRYFLND